MNQVNDRKIKTYIAKRRCAPKPRCACEAAHSTAGALLPVGCESDAGLGNIGNLGLMQFSIVAVFHL